MATKMGGIRDCMHDSANKDTKGRWEWLVKMTAGRYNNIQEHSRAARTRRQTKKRKEKKNNESQ